MNEKTTMSRIMLCALAFVGVLLLASCDERGPAEEAGAELDDMMEDAQRSLDDARQEAEDALDL